MIKHSQSTQSLQYLCNISKKAVRKGVHFLHVDEHQSFYKLGLLVLMEVGKLVISLQRVLQLLLCSIVMENIQIFYRGPAMIITCFLAQPGLKFSA